MSKSRRQIVKPSRRTQDDTAQLLEHTRTRVVRKAAGTGRLVEVEVASPLHDVEVGEPARRGVLVVQLFGRHRVELPPDFCEEDVRRLVRALSPEDIAC